MEHRQFESMLAVARARLARHAPEDIAEKAGVRYADGAFQVPTLGQTVTVRQFVLRAGSHGKEQRG